MMINRRIPGLTALLLLSLSQSGRAYAAGAPAGRFSAADGVVTDNKTGLVWQQVAPRGIFTLSAAVTYCDGAGTFLPGTGWRLPTIKELQSIVDDRVPSPGPMIDPIFMFAPTLATFVYWSSTPYVGQPTTIAWSVAFDIGATSAAPVSMGLTARCVR